MTGSPTDLKVLFGELYWTVCDGIVTVCDRYVTVYTDDGEPTEGIDIPAHPTAQVNPISISCIS